MGQLVGSFNLSTLFLFLTLGVSRGLTSSSESLELLLLLFFFLLLAVVIVELLLLLGHVLVGLLGLLLLPHEEIDDGRAHQTVAQDAPRVLPQHTPWERSPLSRLVRRRYHPGVALSALRHICWVFNNYAGGAFKDGDSEVALVALDAPALLVVVVETELALEALDAEVDHVLLGVLAQGDLARHEVVAAHLAALGLQHHLQQPLHGGDVQPEELKFLLEHPQHMV